MSKYRITITEKVPNKARTTLQAMLNKVPEHWYVERLSLDTDKDVTAEVASLVKNAKAVDKLKRNGSINE